MPRFIPLTVLVSLTAAGCTTGSEMVPATTAHKVPDDAYAAADAAAGVRIVGDGNAWSGKPRRLDEVVPLQVTVENGSGRALRIRYDQFSLATNGARLAALPPFQIEGAEIVGAPLVAQPFEPGFEGFHVASPYTDYYPGSPWAGHFDYDHGYYDTYYAAWPVDLPTEDMIEGALPEGVVADGGKVTGFLYFGGRAALYRDVRFTVNLIDVQTGEEFGRITIPFVMSK